MREIEYEELTGIHYLTGMSTKKIKYRGEETTCVLFTLDGKTYTAIADSSDGYGSYLRGVYLSKGEPPVKFPPLKVNVLHTDGECENMLKFYDYYTCGIVLQIGTEYNEICGWYPTAILRTLLGNMKYNNSCEVLKSIPQLEQMLPIIHSHTKETVGKYKAELDVLTGTCVYTTDNIRIEYKTDKGDVLKPLLNETVKEVYKEGECRVCVVIDEYMEEVVFYGDAEIIKYDDNFTVDNIIVTRESQDKIHYKLLEKGVCKVEITTNNSLAEVGKYLKQDEVLCSLFDYLEYLVPDITILCDRYEEISVNKIKLYSKKGTMTVILPEEPKPTNEF